MKQLIRAGFLLATFWGAATAMGQDKIDIRPGLKEGVQIPVGPAQAKPDDGRPTPIGAFAFAGGAALAILAVICYPSRRQ